MSNMFVLTGFAETYVDTSILKESNQLFNTDESYQIGTKVSMWNSLPIPSNLQHEVNWSTCICIEYTSSI